MMNTQLPYFYETEVEWTGERKGIMRSRNLPSIEVSTPPEFKGPDNFWTPEHFYVASANLCFMTTFLAIAEISKLEFAGFNCQAAGKLEKLEGQGLKMTEITLHPKIVIRYSRDLERARKILEKAESNCLISNSIKSLVHVMPEINFEEESASISGA